MLRAQHAVLRASEVVAATARPGADEGGEAVCLAHNRLIEGALQEQLLGSLTPHEREAYLNLANTVDKNVVPCMLFDQRSQVTSNAIFFET